MTCQNVAPNVREIAPDFSLEGVLSRCVILAEWIVQSMNPPHEGVLVQHGG